MAYPDARMDGSTDTLTGLSFPDPYRWLEHPTAEVQSWQQRQAELAGAYVREWPFFDRLRDLVARFSTESHLSLPRYAGQWFRMHVPPGASQAQVLVSDEPMGEGRVLWDPASEDPGRPPFLSWISPSPDGRVLALGVCADGSENNSIRLVEVASGKLLPDAPTQTLMDNWTGGAHWLPDSSGFFFSAITGSAVEFVQKVYLHRRAGRPTTTLVDIAWTEAKDWRMVVVSRDGRHAVAIERIRNPVPVAIAELGKGDELSWRPFVTAIKETVAGHVIGDRYIAVTDRGAARGRVVAVPLDARDPNDPDQWQELIGESTATLRTVTPVGSTLYLTEFVDTYARVRVMDLDGRQHGQLGLPGRGALAELPLPMMNLIPPGHPDRFLFGFSSLTQSSGIYSHTPGASELEVLKGPAVRLEGTVVEDCWARSADGTRVPYHIVRQSGSKINEPQPTLIWAYGGFNAPWVPQFPGPMAAFVVAGGAFVHAHLRGGAEFGRPWWEGGRMRNKQNCYQDLYAIAEQLIAANRCSPRTLAVVGASNGGLMAGVALTQRPDLWRVVIPRVPFLDLIGACREPYGRMAVTLEFADVEDREEVRRLAAISPYHLIRDGVRYPAVFIDAGDTDPRCPPWHARKFIARLQRASSGEAPILLHIWDKVGHGWATNRDIAVTEHTEWLAFTLRELNVQLAAHPELS